MFKYEKLKELKRGGFGIVYECRRRTDRCLFAMKELSPNADADTKARFRREVDMLSNLDHPNVIKVIDSQLEVDPYYYVMPLYRHSLQERMGTLIGDERSITKILGPVLDAVEYAHGERIVHRDLKPANILMNNDSDIVIADFGIGFNTDPEANRHTSTGVRMGSAWYMPPEQRSNAKDADPRSDIFALGRLLDELYRGPFAERGANVPELPPQIAYLVERCTEENRDQRFQSVARFKTAYHTFVNLSQGKAKLEYFTELRAQLSVAPPRSSNGMMDRFLVLFVGLYRQVDDLLVDTMLALHPAALASLYGRDRASMKNLITGFCNEVAGRSWPFPYTDDISDRCLGIFHAIKDPQVRARLVACLVSLGVSHNRYKVMRDAAGLIHRAKVPTELLALLEELKRVPESERRVVAEYLQRRRLEDPLRRLFPSE